MDILVTVFVLLARRRSPVANDVGERRGSRYGGRGRLRPGRRRAHGGVSPR
ncbi:hypothetical protein [Streptomyces sp. NBC_00334]|uniref:hypothetical protein n=1 Tax=Streptomyces sp. NBC_00334 TaxID=2975713 RepID=UPI002E2AE3C9|nr:hypothetical protein [Streptomyces sp. NBC_00334]